MYCAKCGSRIQDGAKFCSHCGQKMAASGSVVLGQGTKNQAAYPDPATGAEGVKQSGKKKRIRIIAAALAVVVALGIGAVVLFTHTDSPENTVARLETSFNQLDMDGILDCFDTQTQELYEGISSLVGELTDGYDLDMILSLVSGVVTLDPSLGTMPVIGLEVEDVEYTDSDSCTVQIYATVTYDGSCDMEELTCPMEKSGNRWVFTLA